VRENFAYNICVSESDNAPVEYRQDCGLKSLPTAKSIGQYDNGSDTMTIQVPGHPESLSE
jgi:hypothetical protein